MSFQNLNIVGETFSKETVEVTEVNAKEISVDCGNETLTFRGEIKQVLRKARVSTGAAVRVDLPDGSSKFVSSLESPELYNADGSEKAAPAGAKYTPVYSGKAAQEEENNRETNQTPDPEEDVVPQPELPVEDPSVEEAPQTTDF